MHALFDAREILGRERRVAREIVIEAGVGRGAERDLRLGIEFLHRLGHDVRGVVADDLQRLGRGRGDDGDRGVAVEARGEVARLAVDHDGERRLGQARADRRRNLGAGDRAEEMTLLAVGQGDGDAAGVQGLNGLTHGDGV